MSWLIKNCRLLHENKSVSKNICIDDGKIAEISASKKKADKTIDAQNNFVIPGLIDSHVHFREPGFSHKEDWLSGSRAAAAGGITTVLDMPNTNPATTTLRNLVQKRKIAAKSIVNYGFHFGASKTNLDELIKVEDVASIKVFMGSSTGDLLVDDIDLMEKIFSTAKQIITVHAEDEGIIGKNTQKFRKVAKPSHLWVRPNKCAEIALRNAINLTRKCRNRLYVCHVSTANEMGLIVQNKRRTKLYAEVTPHHLFLNNITAEKLGNFGKTNPPIRREKDRVALWQALKYNLIDTIATDHAPHLSYEKEKSYWESPSGVPGVETMLPLLLNEVNKGNITLKKVVDLASKNPAKIFRIKNKGEIRKGFDADLTIVDMKKEGIVRDEQLHTKCKWSPFTGMKLKGWPVTTIVNGNIVFDKGEIYNVKAEEIEYL